MKSCRVFLVLLLVLSGLVVGAQRDSSPVRARTDSSINALRGGTAGVLLPGDTVRRDTFLFPPLRIVPRRFDSLAEAAHPFLRFRGGVRLRESVHRPEGKEAIFYSTMGLLLLFALARNVFARYLQDLFRIFFHANLKQRQAKEGLPQSPLPSIFLNFLFVLSGALFAVLLIQHFGLGTRIPFWQLLGYVAAALAVIYLAKFLVLLVVGWVFRVPVAAESYLFIIFTANKIIGMVLLPFIVLLAFSSGGLSTVALTLSLILLGGIYAYRYFLSWVTVQRLVRLGFFHFVLYFLAFELAPLLLINKLLFRFLG
ncbi:DUF4271 domain-containing protein [Flaviaesturariibacter flavus]|nr:DUF4271 domain-containing protein [Flaviaesturariibacter flavus]